MNRRTFVTGTISTTEVALFGRNAATAQDGTTPREVHSEWDISADATDSVEKFFTTITAYESGRG